MNQRKREEHQQANHDENMINLIMKNISHSGCLCYWSTF